MLRPPRDRQQCPTVSSPFARASSRRSGLFIFIFVMAAFALVTILPSRAVSQTTTEPVPTGAAIISTDLPAHASTVQTDNGPVSLLPGTIPANNAMTEETEIPSLATQYHQTLTRTAPARPARHQQSGTSTLRTGRQVQPTTKALTPTVANTSSKKTSAVNITAPVETAAPAVAGKHLIQLGAFRDTITAETYWASFRIRYPALAKTYEKQIIAADLGSQGIYHRLQLTGFVTPDSAKQQCRQLQADGTDCFAAN